MFQGKDNSHDRDEELLEVGELIDIICFYLRQPFWPRGILGQPFWGARPRIFAIAGVVDSMPRETIRASSRGVLFNSGLQQLFVLRL